MDKLMLRIALLALFIMTWAPLSYAAPLPSNRTLTIKLSAVYYSGAIKPVGFTTAKTDAQGKFTFSFTVVPTTDCARYLYLQVFDGSNMLRQSLVPAPENGGSADAGISEINDLQTRMILKSGGNLAPFRMVAALTMLRTTALSADDADKIGNAIGAASDAFYAALYDGGASRQQIAVFDKELLAGLKRTMALYRQSVDVATASDVRAEALIRYQAIAQMLRELLSASSVSGIPLAVTDCAFAAAGGAAQTSLEQQNTTPVAISLVKMCFVNQTIVLKALRTSKERLDALVTLGYSATSLPRYYSVFNKLNNLMINAQKGIEIELANQELSSAQYYEISIFNSLAIRDIVYIHIALGYFEGVDALDTSEYDNLISIVIARMARTDGVMSGMTRERLKNIFDNDVSFPIWWTEIPLWAYIQPTTPLHYTPIPDLALQVSTPPMPPLFSQLSGPYKTLAELQYDVLLTEYLIRNDAYLEEERYPNWIMPLSALAALKYSAQQRVTAVTSRISGITDAEKKAFIPMLSGVAGIDYF